MVTATCLFCSYSNLASAKFCNDCGSPLHLKPCSQCEAINDRAAEKCYMCGAELPVSLIAAKPALRSREVEVELARMPLPESPAENLHVLPRESADEIAGAREHPFDVLSQPRLFGVHPIIPPPAPHGGTHVVPLPEIGSPVAHYRKSRAALFAVLAIGVALSVYYAYRQPEQFKNGLVVRQSIPSAAIDAPSAPKTTTIVGATLSSPALGVSAADVPPVRPIETRAVAESASKITVAPRTRVDVQSSRLGDVNNDASAPPPAPRIDSAKKASNRGSATTTRRTDEITLLAIPQGGAAQAQFSRPRRYPPTTAATNAVRPRTTDIRADESRDVQRTNNCTQAVAALGFCNLGRQGELK